MPCDIFYDIEKLLHPYMKTTLEKGGKEMSKKECRKLVCVLALSLLMAVPGNGIAQMASASNSITTLSVVEKMNRMLRFSKNYCNAERQEYNDQ